MAGMEVVTTGLMALARILVEITIKTDHMDGLLKNVMMEIILMEMDAQPIV